MCACLPQHPWLFIFSSRGHDQQSSDQNFSSWGHDRQSSEQNNRKLIILRRTINMHMDLQISSCWEHISLFFTQNWCNITLIFYLSVLKLLRCLWYNLMDFIIITLPFWRKWQCYINIILKIRLLCYGGKIHLSTRFLQLNTVKLR
jgi:hypothetical protein